MARIGQDLVEELETRRGSDAIVEPADPLIGFLAQLLLFEKERRLGTNLFEPI